MIIASAKSEDLIILDGVQQHGLYPIQTKDILPKLQNISEMNSENLNLNRNTENTNCEFIDIMRFLDIMMDKNNIFSVKNHATNLDSLLESVKNLVDSVTIDKEFKKRNLQKMIFDKENFTTKDYMENMIILINDLIEYLNLICNLRIKHLFYDIKKDFIKLRKKENKFVPFTITSKQNRKYINEYAQHTGEANASYYTNVSTVHVSTAKLLVRYFHEAWNHMSKESMINIVHYKLIKNLPDCLTEKMINKYFPQCDACPHGNLSKRPIISRPIDRNIETGEEWQVDMKGPWTDKNGKISPTFSGAKWSLTAMDMNSKFKKGFLLQNKGHLLRYFKNLQLTIKQRRRILKRLRVDSEFVTDEINTWAMNNSIELLPCIPHEHETLPDIERAHRSIQEIVVKVLHQKTHMSARYWGMAYFDVLMKMNMSPCPTNPSVTPYELWFGKKPDMLNDPFIPFGSIVKAWIPLDEQTALSGRSIQTYYTGMAPDYKGGILLFNPQTKRTIVRRTYKVMGPVDQIPSAVEYETLEYKPIDNSNDSDMTCIPSTSTPEKIDDFIIKTASISQDDSDAEIPDLVGGEQSDDEDDETDTPNRRKSKQKKKKKKRGKSVKKYE